MPTCVFARRVRIVGPKPGTRHLVGRDIGIRRLVSLRSAPFGAPALFFRRCNSGAGCSVG